MVNVDNQFLADSGFDVEMGESCILQQSTRKKNITMQKGGGIFRIKFEPVFRFFNILFYKETPLENPTL